MEYKKNLIPGVVLAAFSIAYLGCSFQITPFTGLGSTPLDNRFVPWLWGGLLLLLAQPDADCARRKAEKGSH